MSENYSFLRRLKTRSANADENKTAAGIGTAVVPIAGAAALKTQTLRDARSL